MAALCASTRANPVRLRSLNLLLIGISMLLHGCGSDTPEVTRSPDQPDSSATVSDKDIMAEGQFHTVRSVKEKYEVTYHDDTVIVSEEAMRSLVSISEDQETLEFEVAARSALNLQQGQVTIFPLTALRRVVSWRDAGEKIIVETEPALLTDAIKDADIELVTKVGWKVLTQQAVNTSGVSQTGPIRFRLMAEAYADDGGESPTVDASRDGITWSDSISFSSKLGKGLELKFKLKPESWDKLGFELVVNATKEFFKKSLTQPELDRTHRTEVVNAPNWFGANSMDRPDPIPGYESGGYGDDYVGALVDEPTDPELTSPVSVDATFGGKAAVIKATGSLSGFQNNLELAIDASALHDFSFVISHLKSEVKLEAASLNDIVGVANLKVPLQIAIPMRVGLIPVTLKVGADFSFRPIVHDGSAKLCFIVTHDGATGVRFKEGALSNQSDAQDRTLTTCPESETVSAGKITVGMGGTVKFPSISMAIFGNAIVPNVHVKLDGQTLYEPGIANAQPACQSGSATLAAIMGIKMSFLGPDLERTAKLWESKKKWNCDDKVVATTFDRGTGEQTTVTDR